jgi:large subunit ribosomal protein L44
MHRRLAAAAAVHRRLVTTAARLPSVASSAVPKFPPPLSYYEKSDVPKKALDPQAWAAIQPPPRSALVAFAHRLGLASVLTSPDLVLQACTHPSFLHLHRQFHPTELTVSTNAQLESLGNSLMGIFASEFLFAAYPYLPTRVLMAAVTAYVGGSTCAAVAQEMGASPLLRWHRIVCPQCLSSASPLLTSLFSQKSDPNAQLCIQMPLPPFPAPSLPSSINTALFPPPVSTSTPTFSAARSTSRA